MVALLSQPFAAAFFWLSITNSDSETVFWKQVTVDP
jgi:hypothetical protein